MKIGIDLDGVVFNTEALWATYAELYDILTLKRNSIIKKDETLVQTKYAWNKEETDEYFEKYVYDAPITLVPGAKEVITLLKEMGCKLIVITARGTIGKESRETVFRTLRGFKIEFDKYYFGETSKLEAALKENIDLMVEDNYKICKELSKNNIKCLYFHSLRRKHIKNDKNIHEVYKWGEVYRYIHELNK